jgi:uncharacterized cysteine cluster protein YcgN (CxxCxxCC family)
MPSMNEFFWREKSLAEMSGDEWESLCDGCGKCCLHKIEDEDTGEIFFSRVACGLLDIRACRCTRYAERVRLVADCLELREGFTEFHWLPSTCAYRLLAQGRDLPSWHPLLTGDAESVHRAGVSVRAFALSEHEVEDPYEPIHILEWLE